MSLICGPSMGGGKQGMLAAFQLAMPTSAISSKRHNSSNARFLTKLDLTSLRRGRGGRSSFSGVVATVFGASGFTGKYLVNRLGKTGTQMIIPYRCEPKYIARLKVAGDLGQILFMPFDIKNEDDVKRAVQHSNVVINLLGREFETKNFNYQQANVDTAQMIAKCAREMGVERLIHISSLNCRDEHEGFWTPGGSRFLKSKAASEDVVRQEFPDATIFRPSDIYGQGDNFLGYYGSFHRVARGHELLLPNGGEDIWKQPVHASDFAQAICNAAVFPESAGLTYEIAGPRRYELGELADYLFRVMNRGEEWGYVRRDMRYRYLYRLKAHLMTNFMPYYRTGHIFMDKFEREAISDNVTCLPTLDDLGVTRTILEDVAMWELKPYKHRGYDYRDVYGLQEIQKVDYVPGI